MRNRVKQNRLQMKLSQKELSALAKVGQATISNIETERYTPRVDVAINIAKVLKCTVEDLFDVREVQKGC